MFRKGRRGITALALLAVALTVSAAGTVLVWPSSRSDPGPGPIERARTAYENREFEKAESILTHIDSPAADLIRAKIRRDTGRTSEARDLFMKILKKDPRNSDAVQGLAQVYTSLKQDEFAVPFWRELCTLRPDDAFAWRELALAQVRLKDAIGAMTSIQRSLELKKDQEDLQMLLTELAMGGLDFDAPTPGTTNNRHSSGGYKGPNIPDPSRHFPKANWSGQ